MTAKIDFQNDISIITLDDGKANVFSQVMLENLYECLSKVHKDKGCLVITGRKGMFSAGFDLKTFASGDKEKIAKMVTLGNQLLYDIYTFPRPVIVAASGHSIALGVFILCCADYRIGVTGEYICQANEVRNNMDIPTQMMEILKDRVSKKHFYNAVLHGLPFSTVDAVEVGYLDEVVSEESLMKAALEKAEDLATLGHPFYENTKRYAKDETAKVVLDAMNKFKQKVL